MYHIYPLEADWRHRQQKSLHKFKENNLKEEISMWTTHITTSFAFFYGSLVEMFAFLLTQDKNLCAGFHWGYTVSNAALPRALVLLGERLQEQRTVGFCGVRCTTSQVDLARTHRQFTHETKLSELRREPLCFRQIQRCLITFHNTWLSRSLSTDNVDI